VGGFVLGQPSSLNSTNCAVKQALAGIGHCFGGLLTQLLAGRGLSAVSVAIDPAPFRGVPPLPISALRLGSPVLHNPANRNRAVPLTDEQFRYAFANAVSEDEAHQLYEKLVLVAAMAASSGKLARGDGVLAATNSLAMNSAACRSWACWKWAWVAGVIWPSAWPARPETVGQSAPPASSWVT
jgi:hypothetical protein